MGKLNSLGITVGNAQKAEQVFDSLFLDFLEVTYEKPSEYVTKYWNAYLEHSGGNNTVNGKIFEYILATLCLRERIYLSI